MTTKPVQTCKRCLYDTNHPLGLVLDSEGICSGCRVHEEKDTLDWAERWQRLEELVKPYRSRDSRNYDCIVPVTGAGDSFFIVHVVKERLGLKPLLVTYNRYYNTPLGIRNLAQLRRRFDCDILIQSVNPLSVKKIIRTTLRKLGSFHWPVLAGQSVFPVQTAVSHKVPLIIWGAHQGVEQVGMFSHLHEVEMSRRHRKDHDLMGCEADDLLRVFNDLREEDIWQYRYPDESEISAFGVRGIYLGNYIRWDQHAQHVAMVNMHGYKGCRFERTFDIFDHVDDWHYCGIHDYIKYQKHGYGKVLDHASREIRHGRITRDSAIKLVNNFSSVYPYASEARLCEWLGISRQSFAWILSQSTNRKVVLSDKSDSTGFNEKTLGKLAVDYQTVNPVENISALGDDSITIGKGYPDR